MFNTFKLLPLIWLGFVDEIFIVWRGGRGVDNSLIFIKHLNEIDRNMKFTLEHDTDGKLLF